MCSRPAFTEVSKRGTICFDAYSVDYAETDAGRSPAPQRPAFFSGRFANGHFLISRVHPHLQPRPEPQAWLVPAAWRRAPRDHRPSRIGSASAGAHRADPRNVRAQRVSAGPWPRAALAGPSAVRRSRPGRSASSRRTRSTAAAPTTRRSSATAEKTVGHPRPGRRPRRRSRCRPAIWRDLSGWLVASAEVVVVARTELYATVRPERDRAVPVQFELVAPAGIIRQRVGPLRSIGSTNFAFTRADTYEV
jgi:hypothetical protein